MKKWVGLIALAVTLSAFNLGAFAQPVTLVYPNVIWQGRLTAPQPMFLAGFLGDGVTPCTIAQVGCVVSNSGGGGGGGGGPVTAGLGAYVAGSIVDLGTGASPAANTISARLITLNTTLGFQFTSGDSIGNTAFGINGTLPAFAATPTFNLGTLNGAATAANQTSMSAALGSPFQAGGSIANTTFASTQSGAWDIRNITGTATLPTGAATAANQTAMTAALGTPFQTGGSIANTTFASTQSGSWDVRNITGAVTLPTGAATAAAQATLLAAVQSPNPAQTSGSITTVDLVDSSAVVGGQTFVTGSTPTAGSSVAQTINGPSNVTILIQNSGSPTGTVQFEDSADTTATGTYNLPLCWRHETAQFVNTTTTAGRYDCITQASSFFRVRATAAVTGTWSVVLGATPNPVSMSRPRCTTNCVRGSANTTGGSATTIMASAGTGLKNHVTAIQCTNSSATNTIVSFNDANSSVFPLPATSGFVWAANPDSPSLSTAAATAFQFTPGTSVTTAYCNAQGYTGP